MNPLSSTSRGEERLEGQLEEQLGGLAMRFRSTRSNVERRSIAREYAQTVTRLIRSGNWLEMPAPEDQLPDDWMPEEFFEYWSGR
ncbi:MAG: hypothetical protein QOF89_609 [Acidobacteriota bacterium]|jgi:hypothetical protein|nr:hypothetical protein [Acidobacteriota bacterium]